MPGLNYRLPLLLTLWINDSMTETRDMWLCGDFLCLKLILFPMVGLKVLFWVLFCFIYASLRPYITCEIRDISYHCYVDDIQLCVSFKSDNPNKTSVPQMSFRWLFILSYHAGRTILTAFSHVSKSYLTCLRIVQDVTAWSDQAQQNNSHHTPFKFYTGFPSGLGCLHSYTTSR